MGRRKKPSRDEPITIDSSESEPEPETRPEFSVSEIYKDQLSKHRTCWVHVLASAEAQKVCLTQSETEEIIKSLPCLLNFCPHRQRSVRRFQRKDVDCEVSRKKQKVDTESCSVSRRKPMFSSLACTVSWKKQKLDSQDFECYFENLWKSFSEDKKNSFTYFDCLWFSLYMKPTTRGKVITWIKKKHIFSKTYVLVPIVYWSHWSLLIFCHFGENQPETQKPCMLLLDSLEMADPKRLEPNIRKFVLDIFKVEGRPEDRNLQRKIPLLIPKVKICLWDSALNLDILQVPQQRNGEECGYFVLYFIYLFMEDGPQNFSMEAYPYFMKQDWFSFEELDCFCQKLYSAAN